MIYRAVTFIRTNGLGVLLLVKPGMTKHDLLVEVSPEFSRIPPEQALTELQKAMRNYYQMQKEKDNG